MAMHEHAQRIQSSHSVCSGQAGFWQDRIVNLQNLCLQTSDWCQLVWQTGVQFTHLHVNLNYNKQRPCSPSKHRIYNHTTSADFVMVTRFFLYMLSQMAENEGVEIAGKAGVLHSSFPDDASSWCGRAAGATTSSLPTRKQTLTERLTGKNATGWEIRQRVGQNCKVKRCYEGKPLSTNSLMPRFHADAQMENRYEVWVSSQTVMESRGGNNSLLYHFLNFSDSLS